MDPARCVPACSGRRISWHGPHETSRRTGRTSDDRNRTLAAVRTRLTGSRTTPRRPEQTARARLTETARLRAVPAAFYGRTAHAVGTGDSQADRYRQLALCRTVAAACGGRVTAEFFDEDCRADYPWRRRPQGRSLLAALPGPAAPPEH